MSIGQFVSCRCACLGPALPELVWTRVIFSSICLSLSDVLCHLVNQMDEVHHIDPCEVSSAKEIIHSMRNIGVLGAGRLGRAMAILEKMVNDLQCFTFLAMSGPMVPGGLRLVITRLVEAGLIDAIVTSGANIVHDLVEAYGGSHYRVPSGKSDSELRKGGLGRIADITVSDEDFKVFEGKIYDFLDTLSEKQRTNMSPSLFLHDLGISLTDEESIIRQAAKRDIPIFSPGLIDSMLGFHMYTYSTTKKCSLDFVKDMRILGEIVNSANRTGAVILGGGLTKHFTMGSTILRGGLDLAIQITLDRPEGGSLGGAPLREGVSWEKVQESGAFETVIGDATIVFPFMAAGLLN